LAKYITGNIVIFIYRKEKAKNVLSTIK